MVDTTRRGFLTTVGAATTGVFSGIIGRTRASSTVRVTRQFVAAEDATASGPISDARIAYHYYDRQADEYQFEYARTHADGRITIQVPAGTRVGMGFYKSSRTEFLAHRLDGVPHIQALPTLELSHDDYEDSLELPVAHVLDARAVFAGKPGGVEDATPRFGSVRNRSYFASGYSFTTTDEDGFMKLKDAPFTGIEMAGPTRLWMYPPTYVPYQEQSNGDYRQYDDVTKRDVDVSDDLTVELDISRRKQKQKNHGNR